MFKAVILAGNAALMAISMENLAQAAIEAALRVGATFADVRIENTTSTIIEMSDGVTRRAVSSHLKGAGIRAFVDGAWAFGQTTDLTLKGMQVAGESVARLALATRSKVRERFDINGPAFRDHVKLTVKRHFHDVGMEEKMAFAKQIDSQAREYDSRIANTRTVYGDSWTELYVANSLGTSVYIENSLPRIISVTTAKEGSNRQRAFKSVGVRGGFEAMETDEAQTLGTQSAELAVNLLSSVAAKGGVYDVVMDPVLNGVMVHEAFGHACEADNWPAHTTVLEDRVGKEVGPEHLNISDDPTLPGLRGSFEYDWEGTRTRKRYLVRKGVLTELLHSLETASRLGMEPNGAARAQSFMYMPIPRMSNTFMEPGDWTFEEMLSEMKEGIYAVGALYGYTDPAKGQFMFKAEGGWLIENGELKQRLREVAIAGMTLEVLHNVDAVGKDLQMDPGMCGKLGQYVPVTTGSPHVRVKKLVFGGR